MYKKCKVVMLPTDEKASVYQSKLSHTLGGFKSFKDIKHTDCVDCTPSFLLPIKETIGFHLYILSDDEIKTSDWWMYIDLQGQAIFPTQDLKGQAKHDDLDKKIIASTDSSLCIKDFDTTYKRVREYIPSIPQSFIDHYVSEYNKGNKIEEVMVEYLLEEYEDNGKRYHHTDGRMTPKLNADNTISIKLIKDNWTREEVINLLTSILTATGKEIKAEMKNIRSVPYIEFSRSDIDKWIKTNL